MSRLTDLLHNEPWRAAELRRLIAAAQDSAVASTVSGFANLAQDTILTGRHVVDTFSRTVASGWGSTDTGEAWTLNPFGAATFHVTAGTGVMAVPGVESDGLAALNVGSADQDMYADFTWPTAVTGDAVNGVVHVRGTDTTTTGSAYRVNLTLDTGGGWTARLQVLGTTLATVASGTFTPGQFLRVRLQCAGTSIRAKVWDATAAEPTWQVSVTDSSLTTGNYARLEVYQPGDNTSTKQVGIWDNVRVYTTPGVVPANSVENSHLYPMAAGTIKGNNTGGTANPVDLTATQVAGILGTNIGAWTAWTPTVTQSTSVSVTVTRAVYAQHGKTVHVMADLAVTGSGTAANAVVIGGLPVNAATSSLQVIGDGVLLDTSATDTFTGVLQFASTNNTLQLRSTRANGLLGAASFTAALDAGDAIRFAGTYEAA